MKIFALSGAGLLTLAACVATEPVIAPDLVGSEADLLETAEDMAQDMLPIDTFDLIQRTAIFGNPERTQGRISPDGTHVSWLAPVDGVLNIYVAPA
ncbi:MAG: S9 family peptidase, partial [Pseudomonadota bacterium]